MLSTNYLHCLFLSSDIALVISSFILSTAGARRGPDCVGRLAPTSFLGPPQGLVACIAYVLHWGYDGKPYIVSFGITSRLSGNQLEDNGSSACVLSLVCIRSSHPFLGLM